MSKRTHLALALLGMLLLFLLAGCGGGNEEQAATTEQAAQPAAEQAATPAAEHPAAEHPAAAVATHDCAGDCGMTNVPEDQLTEIDGKWYCAGCAAKVTGAEAHEEGDGHGHG